MDNKNNRLWVFLSISIALFSCDTAEIPQELNSALTKAGPNRNELERVITYFSSNPNDSLKLKAACFLIQNMEGLYYYEGEQLEQYYGAIKLVKENINDEDYILQALEDMYDPFDYSNLKKQYDLEHVRAEGLINNVDMAFKVWEEQPWGKDISFEQFCEYILPYRLGNAPPEHTRAQIYNKYNSLLDSVRKAGGGAVAACTVLTEELCKERWVGSDNLGFLPHFPVSKLLQHRIGSCRDMTDAAVYIMRAVGIPVSVDFVHKWPYKKNSHAWNAVLNSDGKWVTFMGMEQSPGTTNKPGTKKGKVYRMSYALNHEIVKLQKDQGNIFPPLFREARLKDVTDEYVKTYDLNVSLNPVNSAHKYAYLSVFSNKDWVPVTFSKVQSETAIFRKMEPRIVYLPTYFDKSYKNVPAAFPQILEQGGMIKELRPNETQKHSIMIFENIYPYLPDQFRVVKLWGGRIQGANDKNFEKPTDLYTMRDPMPFWNKVRISKGQNFRYFRYLPAWGYATDLSEMQLYYKGSKLSGTAIGSNGSSKADSTINNVLDNNFGTRFITKYSTGTWVGIDTGREAQIDEIRYAAGINEKKFTQIMIGHKYELLYWGGAGGWISGGSKVATSDKINFFNVPSNALYLLKNLTRESDERIFTYEHDRQIWW